MKSSSMKYGYRYCPRQCHHHISFADPVILEKIYSVRLFTPKMNSLFWKSNLTGAFCQLPWCGSSLLTVRVQHLQGMFTCLLWSNSCWIQWSTLLDSWIQDCSHPRWVSFHLPCFIFGSIMVLNWVLFIPLPVVAFSSGWNIWFWS